MKSLDKYRGNIVIHWHRPILHGEDLRCRLMNLHQAMRLQHSKGNSKEGIDKNLKAMRLLKELISRVYGKY